MADAWVDVTPPGGWPWEPISPGPRLAAVLAAVDPQTLPESGRVSLLKAFEALAGWTAVAGGQAMLAVADASLDAATELGAPWERREAWLGDELAAALRVAPNTALAREGTARSLLRRWPSLGRAVAAGRLTWAQGKAICEAVWVLDGVTGADGRDLSDIAIERLLPTAGRYAPGRLAKRAEAMVLALDPAAAARRRRRAQRERTDVGQYAEDDGLGLLWARAPAADTVAMHQAVVARARAMRAAAADPRARTAGQWRLTALMAALGLVPQPGDTDPVAPTDREPCGMQPLEPAPCDGEPAEALPGPAQALPEPAEALPGLPVPPAPAVPALQVSVVVDLPTLLGLAEDPGHLEGYGPIDPDLARALAGDAEWVRWVTDPVTGHLLDAGGRRLPPTRLRRFVLKRQSRCHQPTCGVRADHCDADHVPAFRDSRRTRALELAPGCPRHNRTREAYGWTAGPDPGPADPYAAPEPIWTSPLGRSYRSLTDPVLPFTTAPGPPGDHPDPGGPDPPDSRPCGQRGSGGWTTAHPNPPPA